MRRLFILLALACSLFTSVPVSALPTAAQTSRSALAALESKVRFYTLSNGLRVMLYRRGDAPVFGGAVGVRVGGSDEEAGSTGISHMFEHMAFKGTDTIGTKDYARERELLAELEDIVAKFGAHLDFPAEVQARWTKLMEELNGIWDRSQFVRELEKRGASELNATTDKEMTRYFMNLPRSSFEFWAWIESERMLHPVMREFYQERDVVKEEKRMRYDDDPGGKLYETMLAVAYLSHPYRNPVIGYDEDLRSLTATAMDEFRRKYYVPSNMAVAVVGDVNPDEDIKVLEKYFGRLPTGPSPARPAIVEAQQQGERTFTLKAPAAPQVYIAYHKKNYPHPDDAPVTLMLEILAGRKTSPLYHELVTKRRIAADIGYSEAPGGAYPNLFLFYATPRSPHTNDEVLRAFDAVVAKFLADPIKEEDLQIAKRAVAVSHLGHLNSNLGLAIDFVTSELIYGDWKAMMSWYDEAMRVTTADIKRVAEQYLRRDTRTVGKLETGEQKEKES